MSKSLIGFLFICWFASHVNACDVEVDIGEPNQTVNNAAGNIYTAAGDELDYACLCTATTDLNAGFEQIKVYNFWVDQTCNPHTVTVMAGQPEVWWELGNRSVANPLPPSYGFQIDVYDFPGEENWLGGTCGVFMKQQAGGGGG